MTLREVNRVGEGQKNVPKLRFKGYEDAWEQRKLGEEVQIVMGQSPKGENYTDNPEDYILVQGNADMKDGKVFPRVWTTQVTKQAHKGDIILSVRAPVGDIGKTDYDVVIGRGVAAVKGNEFFYQLLGKFKLDGYWTKSSTGSTFDSINSNEIKNAKVTIPDINEQLFIGDYFQGIDHLITLHQRKYDALKTMKKTLLSKMFPKDGEDVPEIRFKGFTDAWEQRRLEEIFLKIRNAFVGTSTPYYVEKNQGGHFYIESNNVKHGKINHDTEVFINEEFYQNQKDKWLKTGDIVMVQSGHVGHSAVIPEYLNNSAAHALIMFQEYKIETNPYFINFQFQTESVKNKIDSITTGNTIKHILASDMKLFSISNTQKKEADKLGDFFISLDNLITLHQRKLDELKNIKKTLLQQMFV